MNKNLLIELYINIMNENLNKIIMDKSCMGCKGSWVRISPSRPTKSLGDARAFFMRPNLIRRSRIKREVPKQVLTRKKSLSVAPPRLFTLR